VRAPIERELHVSETVLITGGAGFIGSHLADRLLASGRHVRVLDRLVPQVHGSGERPDYLASDVELQVGDVRDPEAVRRALRGVSEVVHLAARVGVGQSMYELRDYTDENATGTATLLQELVDATCGKLVVASSMSVYGEGAYVDEQGRPCPAVDRTRAQLEQGAWDPVGPTGQPLTPVPTPETKQPALTSVYALGKYDQERLCLIFGQAYALPTVALRFFNVYGPRQALSNPYTGALAIFASRLLNDRPPLVFEDGAQRRDFVSVHDVARAIELALTGDGADGTVVNVGSGRPLSILEVAAELASVLGREIAPEVTGRARLGDIRHCYADVSRAAELLEFEARVTLEEGLSELAEWLEGQDAQDRADDAAAELAARGLTL
jgi:dTDP-L-rhamnose 4-epimerase